jgi:hypothetical protein
MRNLLTFLFASFVALAAVRGSRVFRGETVIGIHLGGACCWYSSIVAIH